MLVKIGTFNLNNLFSRFNFTGVVDSDPADEGADAVLTFDLSNPDNFRVREFRGRLIRPKDSDDTATIAQRIREVMQVDVLAVQEVENIDILRRFNRGHLNDMFSQAVLIEGNDPRFIDVGVLSKLPIGAVTSFQTYVDEEDTSRPIFSRDLLEVEILASNRRHRLFTLYNTHLKSHFGDNDNNGQGKVANDTRRRRQAQAIRQIVAARQRTNSRYILTGDMNDPPDAEPVQAIREIEGQQLINALANPEETRPHKPEEPGNDPQSPAWTHRFKPSGEPPEHRLFDHIWLSSTLEGTLRRAVVDRRTKHGGDGSDHDPAWVELEI